VGCGRFVWGRRTNRGILPVPSNWRANEAESAKRAVRSYGRGFVGFWFVLIPTQRRIVRGENESRRYRGRTSALGGESAGELFMAKLRGSCGHVDPEGKMPGGVRLGDVRVIFLRHVIFLF